MRVTDGTMANMSLNNLQLIRQRLDDLQTQVSTQRKVSNPGDDPLATQQILGLQGQLNDGDQYTKNISTGSAVLSTMESALASMGDSLTRIKEIGIQMANGTYSADQRSEAMVEVKQIREQLISLGNTQSGGRYVFGGSKNDSPPFDASGAYNGNDANISINIDKSSSVVINYSGGKLLTGTGGGTDVSVIGTIDKLTLALSNNDQTGIQNTLSDLDKSMTQVLSARTDIGARMNRLDSTKNFIDNAQLYLQKALSDKQDVDFTKAVSDLTRQQTAFEAALAATAKVSKMSLMDYLT
jgi:flagellar hook-associated protein 3 FlgL